MSLPWKLIRLIVSLLLCNVAFCYPDGSPSGSCTDMLPHHSGTSQSNAPFPFVISLSQSEIFSNGTVQVTIKQSNERDKFQGFLAMGFNSETDDTVGEFLAGEGYKLLSCFSVPSSAVTHKDGEWKESVTFDWKPPVGFDGTVIFKATVLVTFDTYWAKQSSEPLKVITSEPVPSTEQPTTTSSTPLPELPDVYNGCGVMKGCLVIPEAVCIDEVSCSTVITHRKLNDTTLEIELYSKTAKNRYVATGFSTDTKMGDDSVIECLIDGSHLGAFMSFNHPNKRNERAETPINGFRVMSSLYIEGYLYCKVNYPTIHSLNDVDFDLNEPHHILLAYGPSQSSWIEIHDTVKTTSQKVSLTNDVKVVAVGESSRVLKQLHGSFMVIAWLIAGSIAVVMPRYMRKTWVGVKFQGKDMWFVYHRGLMLLTWTLTVIAFVLIFIDVGGWVSESVSENPHPLIGCITTGLAFVQPIMAYFRPAPNAANRYIFNWAHLIVGYSAHTLALTCIFLAVEMDEAQLPLYTYWVLSVHVVCYVAAQATFTLLARRNASVMAELKDDSHRDEPGSSVRRTIFYVYIGIMLGLGFAVVVFIGAS